MNPCTKTNLLLLTEELRKEVKREQPDQVVVKELIAKLYNYAESADHTNYGSHLWDLTFEGTRIESSTEQWFLTWIKEDLHSYKNLRIYKFNHDLVFMRATDRYKTIH